MLENLEADFPVHTPRPASAPKALEGVRVVDFSHFLAGPFASMVMADMGADVIKVEAPGRGDEFRHYPPVHEKLPGQGAPYLWSNRNKRSVAVNMKTPEGIAVVRELIAQARRGARELLGERDEAVRARLRECSQAQPEARLLLRLGLWSAGRVRRPPRFRSDRPGRERLHLDERLRRSPGRSHAVAGDRHQHRNDGVQRDPRRAAVAVSHRRGPGDRAVAVRQRGGDDRLRGAAACVHRCGAATSRQHQPRHLSPRCLHVEGQAVLHQTAATTRSFIG